MIIIAENKKNHYLIKKFLIETDSFDDNLSQDQGGLHRRLISQDEILDAGDPLVDKLIKKRPKFAGIKNFLKIPFIVIPLLYSNNLDDASIKMSQHINNSNSVEQENKKNTTPSEVKKSILNKDDNSSEISNASQASNEKINLLRISRERIISLEKYKPFPYQDRGGISIGYGTQITTNGDASKLKNNGDWRETLYKKCGLTESEIEIEKKESYEDEKKLYIKSLRKKISKIKYKLSPSYHIKFKKDYVKRLKNLILILESRIEAAQKRGIISNKLASICLDKDLKFIFDKRVPANFKNNFYLMHENIRIVVIDMYYNIGPWFLDKTYTNFYKHLNSYIKSLKNNSSSKTISENVKNIYEEIKDRSPDYHAQNAKRANKNVQLLKNTYLEYSQNESSSIKDTYRYLFL